MVQVNDVQKTLPQGEIAMSEIPKLSDLIARLEMATGPGSGFGRPNQVSYRRLHVCEWKIEG